MKDFEIEHLFIGAGRKRIAKEKALNILKMASNYRIREKSKNLDKFYTCLDVAYCLPSVNTWKKLIRAYRTLNNPSYVDRLSDYYVHLQKTGVSDYKTFAILCNRILLPAKL